MNPKLAAAAIIGLGTIAAPSAAPITDWRPLVDDARQQALARRDVAPSRVQGPGPSHTVERSGEAKVLLIGSGGGE